MTDVSGCLKMAGPDVYSVVGNFPSLFRFFRLVVYTPRRRIQLLPELRLVDSEKEIESAETAGGCWPRVHHTEGLVNAYACAH